MTKMAWIRTLLLLTLVAYVVVMVQAVVGARNHRSHRVLEPATRPAGWVLLEPPVHDHFFYDEEPLAEWSNLGHFSSLDDCSYKQRILRDSKNESFDLLGGCCSFDHMSRPTLARAIDFSICLRNDDPRLRKGSKGK
jgi:hypothetical protein